MFIFITSPALSHMYLCPEIEISEETKKTSYGNSFTSYLIPLQVTLFHASTQTIICCKKVTMS